jgi:hypothetical protein
LAERVRLWDTVSGSPYVSRGVARKLAASELPVEGETVAENTGEIKFCGGWPDVSAVRQSKGITLDQIVQTTKISKRFLEAIEAGDFAKLPGGIFNTSYIRQYARAIDYDESELVERYRVWSGENAAPVNGVQGPRKPASRLLTVLARP